MSNTTIDLVKKVPLNSSHLMAINEALGDIASYRQMIDVKINKINTIVRNTLLDNYSVVEEEKKTTGDEVINEEKKKTTGDEAINEEKS